MTNLDTNPSSIGKYRLIASLGAGGMAKVYLAVVSGPGGFNKLLVLKLLREELAQDQTFKVMFLDEARLAARLNHPNVVQTFEVGEESSHTFLAMEYLEGQSLSAILRKLGRTDLPLTCHVRLLVDMLAGLHHAHELADFDGTPLRVVHRDISPHNVMVTYEGVVKLMDFGIAAAATASQTTEAGIFKGKASYAAPEQVRGEKVDRRADLFAVGVMLWEALAGRRLSENKQDIQMMHQRIAGLDPPIDEVAPEQPAELRAVCARAMQQEPAHRYATAREMQQALLAWLQSQAPAPLGDVVAEAFAEERRRLRTLVEEAVRRAREDRVGNTLPQISTGVSLTPSHGSPSPMSASSVTPLPSPMPSLPPRAARSSLWIPGLVGVVLVASGLAAASRVRDGALPMASPATSSAPPLSAPPSAPAVSTVVTAPAEAPSTSAAVSAAPSSPLPPSARVPAVQPPRIEKTTRPEAPPEGDRAATKSKKSKRAIDDGDPYAR